MARDKKGLEHALGKIPGLREEFWKNVNVPGSGQELNQSLEVAGRVADFLELGELMCLDALERDESCGCHFRLEHQMADGEAKRNDEKFCHVAAWEYAGEKTKPNRHVEPLTYENVELARRGATSEDHAEGLAAEGPEGRGPLRHLRGGGRQSRHVLPRDARRRQRGAGAEGRGPDRLRPRLPRGHLRHLRLRHQRPGPRPAGADDRLPAPHAELLRRRRAHARALAGRVLSGRQGPRRGPRRRSTASSPPAASSPPRSAALRTATRSRSARRTPTSPWTPRPASAAAPAWPPAPTPRRCSSPRPRSPTSRFCRRASPSGRTRARRMVAQMDAEGFGTCTNHGECEAACPKGIRMQFIGMMNADFTKAVGRRRPPAERLGRGRHRAETPRHDRREEDPHRVGHDGADRGARAPVLGRPDAALAPPLRDRRRAGAVSRAS